MASPPFQILYPLQIGCTQLMMQKYQRGLRRLLNPLKAFSLLLKTWLQIKKNGLMSGLPQAQNKGNRKNKVEFLNPSQSLVLLEYYKLSRIYGLSFGLILSLLGCAILVQLLMIASNDNYFGVIFSSSTFYIIKSAVWQAFLSTFFSLLVGMLVHERFTGEGINGLLNLFYLQALSHSLFPLL